MLYIDYNVPEDRIIHDPTGRFRYQEKGGWFDDPEVLRVAKEIDGVDHIAGQVFQHPDLGYVMADSLSGGFHTVVLAYKGCTDGFVLPLSWLGENCFPVLGSLNVKDDIVFDADYMPQLMQWNCDFVSKASGAVINNYYDYFSELRKYIFETENNTWY